MISLVNFHTNATSKRWRLLEIDLQFSLNSTPGWFVNVWFGNDQSSESELGVPTEAEAGIRKEGEYLWRGAGRGGEAVGGRQQVHPLLAEPFHKLEHHHLPAPAPARLFSDPARCRTMPST